MAKPRLYISKRNKKTGGTPLAKVTVPPSLLKKIIANCNPLSKQKLEYGRITA